MRDLHPIAKVFAVIGGLLLLLIGFFVWELGFTHHLSTVNVGSHELRLSIDHYWDVSDSVLCELRGPKVQHSVQLFGYIGAGEKPPSFSVHQASGQQIYWITADTMPKAVIYGLDCESGEYWTRGKSEDLGKKFLKIAESTESGYRLYQYEWIGVR